TQSYTLSLHDALPIFVEDPNTGNIYVAELGGQRLVLLKPIAPKPVATIGKSVMVFNDVASSFTGGAGSSASQIVTITNTGNLTRSEEHTSELQSPCNL